MPMPPITIGDLLMWLIEVRDREGADIPVYFECFAGVMAHQEPLTTWRLCPIGHGKTIVLFGNGNARVVPVCQGDVGSVKTDART